MKYSNLKNNKYNTHQDKHNNKVSFITLILSQLKFKRDIAHSNSNLSSGINESVVSPSESGSHLSISKLSEAILNFPKCLTDNNTKLSLVEKSITYLDNLYSQKL